MINFFSVRRVAVANTYWDIRWTVINEVANAAYMAVSSPVNTAFPDDVGPCSSIANVVDSVISELVEEIEHD